MRQRHTLAALTTVVIIVVMVILPLTLITAALVEEATGVYARIQSGELNFGRYFEQIVQALPPWAGRLLERSGLTTLGELQQRLSAGLMRASQFLAARAIEIGQSTFEFIVSLFVMLYLLFFLLRDGEALFRRVKRAIPLREEQQHELFERFAVVIRATMKGSIVVAILQGALGGLMFWLLGIRAPLLGGVLMAVLSLLPAVGPALVWVPVALYLLVTGAVWQGVVLIAYGVLVIGLVDNVVRPYLVGTETKMPDYVVLISTLGGLATLGVNGFVIGPVIAAMFMAAWDLFSASRPARDVDRSGL
jgi:predicted PurR-regulated permease PerM